MAKTKNKIIILSKCCGAKTVVRSSPDEIDKIGCTMFYVCLACGNPCDIYGKERKSWKINPATKVIKDKREKEKNKLTEKEIQEIRLSQEF